MGDVSTVLDSSFGVSVDVFPSSHHLPSDPGFRDNLHEPGPVTGSVRLDPLFRVIGPAQVMTGVAVRFMEMDEADCARMVPCLPFRSPSSVASSRGPRMIEFGFVVHFNSPLAAAFLPWPEPGSGGLRG